MSDVSLVEFKLYELETLVEDLTTLAHDPEAANIIMHSTKDLIAIKRRIDDLIADVQLIAAE